MKDRKSYLQDASRGMSYLHERLQQEQHLNGEGKVCSEPGLASGVDPINLVFCGLFSMLIWCLIGL